MCVNVASVAVLGAVTSTTTHVVRDLGFQGKLGPNILLTFGDTLYRNVSYDDKFLGMTSDSVALATSDPLKVCDTKLNSQNWPEQFCPVEEKWGEDMSTDAMGITNVMEITDSQGIIFFLKNHRPDGVNNIIGAGVAVVTMDGDVPSAERTAEYWWDGTTEAWYGDVCAYRCEEYIYAFGHGNDLAQVYVARVKAEDATSLVAYEYWNGTAWQKQRLRNPTEENAIQGWWQTGQGQVIWSVYYQKHMFIYNNNFADRQVLARTADIVTGPWSEAFTIYKIPGDNSDGMPYTMIPHPYFDESGKTLVIAYTISPNRSEAIRVTFE